MDDDAIPGRSDLPDRSTAGLASSAEQPSGTSWPAGRLFRSLALLAAVLPISLLVLASRLEPNSAGLGTHQQLGLPPCSMRVMMGIRCPGCGMTTSWAHFTRGQWASSFQVNSGGFLLAIYSLAFAFVALGCCMSGNFPSLTTQRVFVVGLLAVAAVTLVDWTIRLAGG